METSAKTILLVEDEALIALSETRKLNQVGYKVIHALTGESAIAIANEKPAAIDLILMDINLGSGIDGTQAAQDILKIHDIPIVFLSSHMEPEVVKKTEEITNYGYVVKSSVFTVLDASIKMAFKLFRAKRQLDLNSMEIESTNEELRKSLAKFQNAYEGLALQETMQKKIFRLSPEAICITRVSDGVYKEVNQSFSRLFGFTREEAIGRSCFSGDLGIWIHQDEREKLAGRLRQDGGGISFEMGFRRRDGTTIMTSTSAELIEINGEDCVISSMRDISTSKRYEDELRESEERYRILFEEAGAGILIYDGDLRILEANKKSVQMFGYSKEELLAISLRELDPDLADPVRLGKLAKGIFESGPFSFAADRRLKNGTNLPVEVNAMTIIWQGKPAIMAIIHDISAQEEMERKYARAQATLTAHEEKLRESEERFRLAMEASKDAIWDIDIGKSQVYFNPAYFSLFGYGQEDASFIATWPTYFHSDEFEALSPIIGDCIENRRQAFDVDYRATLSDGLSRWLNVRGKVVERDSNGRAKRLLGTIHNISERKAVEAELREKESQLKTIGDNVPAFLAILDAHSLRYQYVNRMYELSYGHTKEQILGKTVQDIAGSENYQNAANFLAKASHGQRTTYERRFSLAQGEVWARVDYVPQFDDDGNVERILILGVDITDFKNTAEALEKSEERFRLAMDAADEGIWDHDLLADEIYYSPAYYHIVGYSAEEIGKPGQYEKYVHPGDDVRIISALSDCVKNMKDDLDVDYRIQIKDGTWKWMNTRGKVVERDTVGKATRIIGTSRDITDSKQGEERIAAISNELQTILDTAPIGIAKIVGGKYAWINKAIPRLFNYSRDYLIDKDLSILFPTQEAYDSVASHILEKLSEGGGAFQIVQRLIRGDGTPSTIYLSGKAIDEADPAKGFILTGEDISEQKRLEDRLRASEAKYRALFSAVADSLCIIDRESGIVLDCNQATVNMFGYGREEIIGTNFMSTCTNPDESSIENDIGSMIPLRNHRRKDGTEIPLEITTSLLSLNGRHVVVAAMRDISRRIESEGKIKLLLREKEIMLREVHHRIKNNLQVVASILSIRVSDSEDSSVNMILNEAIGEIESMSLLYDKLYRTAYVGTLPVREYLPELLSQAAQVFGGELPLNIETEIDDFALDAAKLSRLGIVINELVTNSLKYAFSGVASPTIKLRVLQNDLRIHLEYEDNGIGLPESFSIESAEGFGMQLILAMMQQVKGTIHAESQGGARFTIDLDAGQVPREMIK